MQAPEKEAAGQSSKMGASLVRVEVEAGQGPGRRAHFHLVINVEGVQPAGDVIPPVRGSSGSSLRTIWERQGAKRGGPGCSQVGDGAWERLEEDEPQGEARRGMVEAALAKSRA